MRDVPPNVSVYFDQDSGDYIVQPSVWAPNRGDVEFGKPTVVQSSAFETSIVKSVLENLEKFGSQIYSPEHAIRRPPKEQRQFAKRYLAVSISQLASGALSIIPLHRKGVSFVGYKEELILLRPREIQKKLAGKLRRAFTIAS